MREIFLDEYIYIDFINFNILKKKKNFIKNEKIPNKEYIILETIDKSNKSISDNLLDYCKEEIIININKKFFLDKIRKGYIYNNIIQEKEIWEQFLKDVNRSKFYLNNNKININNSLLFKGFLESKYNLDKVKDILMIFTQATLAYPFEIIQNNIEEKFLSEINIVEKRDCDNLNIFMYTEPEIQFIISKRMRIFKFDKNYNDITTDIIRIEIDFNLDSDEYILMKLYLDKNI